MPLFPVDGAPDDQGQGERPEAAERAGGAAAPEHGGEDVRDLEQQARERLERVWRRRPEQPIAAEVQEHEISGHEPYRSWCRAASQAGTSRCPRGRPAVEKVFPSSELTTATCGAKQKSVRCAAGWGCRRGSARWSPNFVASAMWKVQRGSVASCRVGKGVASWRLHPGGRAQRW